MRFPRTILRALVTAMAAVLAVGAAAVTLTASPAGAHGGDAVFAVEAAEPQPDGSVHYVVRVTWKDDGHPAVGSTVTATPVDGAGATQTPVPMTAVDQDGRYEATVSFPAPGAWKIRFTSINPNGSSEQAQQVSAPATTASPAAPTTSSSAPADGATSAESSQSSEAVSAASQSDDDGGGGGSGGAVVVGLVVLVLLAAGVGLWLWRRSHQHPATPTPSAESAATEGA